MKRQVDFEHKASSIPSNANCYASETVGNESYPLELLQRIISVSMQTLKIVRDLPPLDFNHEES